MKSSLMNFTGRSMSPNLVLNRFKFVCFILLSILLSSLSLKAEDCISFNPNDIAIVPYSGGQYRIIEGGNHAMFLFPNYGEAKQAYNIIKQYGINKSCFVGRPGPSFQYLLVGNNSPTGAISGEDCLSFNPNNIQVKKIGGNWKIVDGSHWMFDFGGSESEARASFKVIKKYGFTKSCFVGRPNASLSYLRKDKGSVQTTLPNLDGLWINEDKNTRGITKVNISRNTSSIEAWGACHPNDCEWGMAKVADARTKYVINYDQGFVRRNIFMKMVTINGVKKLRLLVYSYYNDGRKDQKATYYFLPARPLLLKPSLLKHQLMIK